MERISMVYTPKPGWTKSRRYMRFDIETPAKVRILDDEGEMLYMLNLVTKNICAGGAFFQLSSPLTGGTKVKVEMNLAVENLKKIVGREHKHGFQVHVHGTVVRSVPLGMAVEFNEEYQFFP